MAPAAMQAPVAVVNAWSRAPERFDAQIGLNAPRVPMRPMQSARRAAVSGVLARGHVASRPMTVADQCEGSFFTPSKTGG